jgi:hypothetical protein
MRTCCLVLLTIGARRRGQNVERSFSISFVARPLIANVDDFSSQLLPMRGRSVNGAVIAAGERPIEAADR